MGQYVWQSCTSDVSIACAIDACSLMSIVLSWGGQVVIGRQTHMHAISVYWSWRNLLWNMIGKSDKFLGFRVLVWSSVNGSTCRQHSELACLLWIFHQSLGV
jgi:hypothetical protein